MLSFSILGIAFLDEFLPFRIEIQPLTIAGVALWAIALYLGLSSFNQWVNYQLMRWFNFAERSLYTSAEEFERTRPARESQNAFWASIFSIFPFLVLGTLFYYGCDFGLGPSWGISSGMIAAIGTGVYELGRRSNNF
jgi:hypothetical protein